jgi:purine-binding chemotaxis protein CheW
MQPDPDGKGMRVLVVRLHEELYGIPSESVLEIVAAGSLADAIARLPGAEGHVTGLLNLRGRLVAVVDLAQRILGVPLRSAEPVVLLVTSAERSLALMVDDVEDVAEVVLDPGPSGGASLLCGAGRLADKVVLIVDVDQLVVETFV